MACNQFSDLQEYTFLHDTLGKFTVMEDNLPDALKKVPRSAMLIAVNGDPRFWGFFTEKFQLTVDDLQTVHSTQILFTFPLQL